MVATESLILDILARDNASAALLRTGASADKASGSIAKLQARLDDVSHKSVDARVGLTGDVQAQATLDKIQARLITLGRQTANPNISIEGAARAAAQIAAIDVELDKLKATEVDVADRSWITALDDAASIVSKPLGSGSWLAQLRNFHVPLFAGALEKMGAPKIISSASGFHLLSEAIIETTAVLVPATIAIGAFAAVAAPSVSKIYDQMKNLYTVSQALNTQMPGMTGGFSKLAAAVQPQVYSAFGDALDLMQRKGNGLQTMATGAGAAVDQLAARFELAISSGNGMTKFADNAVTDFSKLGDVIGNLGGAFGNLLHVMPGFAEDLLNVADGASKVFETVTRVAAPVIGIGLAAHGTLFYTGLLATALIKLGTTVVPKVGLAAISAGTKLGIMGEGSLGAAQKLGATGDQLAKLADNLGGVIGPNGFVKVGEDAEEAAGKTGIFGKALGVLSSVPVWGWVAVGAAALGGLVYWLVTSKDATQQWVDSLQNSINTQTTFNGVVKATESAIIDINAKLADTPKYYTQATATFSRYGTNLGEVTQKYSELSAGATKYGNEQKLEQSRLAQLTTDFGSTSKAMGLFNDLHIKATDIANASVSAWKEDIQEVKGYLSAVTELAGYQGGRALAAQNALTLSQNAQAKAVATVTQAEDQYISTLTGGETAFLSYVQALRQTQTASQKTGANLSSLSKNSLTLAGDFWNTLIPAGQKQIDSLNAQFASTKDLTTATATIAKGMIPFAKNNDAARVAIMDLINNALGPGTVNLKDMNTWVGRNSTSMQGFKAIVDKSTISASNLSKELQQDLNVQFHQALLQSTGADSAVRTYTADLDHNRQTTAQGKADRAQLIRDLENAGLSAKQATNYVDNMSRALGKIPHSEKVSLVMTGTGSYSIHQGGQYIQGSPGHRTGPGGQAFATGGLVRGPGTGTSDSILIAASNREYMVKAASVAKYGTHAMDAVNSGRAVIGYADGGLVTEGNKSVLSGQFAVDTYREFEHTFEQAMVTAMRQSLKSAQQAAMTFLGTGVTPNGPLQQYARKLLSAYGWAGQWSAFNDIVMAESGWNVHATNPSSGAYGIPQAYPASKMASAGADWRTDGYTQLRWMMAYIRSAYGSPDAAWTFHLAHNAYKNGGIINEPVLGVGRSGRTYTFAEAGPETVTPGIHPPSGAGGDGISIGSVNINHVPGYSTPQDVDYALRAVERRVRLTRR